MENRLKSCATIINWCLTAQYFLKKVHNNLGFEQTELHKIESTAISYKCRTPFLGVCSCIEERMFVAIFTWLQDSFAQKKRQIRKAHHGAQHKALMWQNYNCSTHEQLSYSTAAISLAGQSVLGYIRYKKGNGSRTKQLRNAEEDSAIKLQ